MAGIDVKSGIDSGQGRLFVDNKINVLLVVRWPAGGIRTFLKYMFKFFPGRNFNFTLITVNSDSGRQLRSDLSDWVKDVYLVDESRAQFKLIMTLFKVLATTKVDLVHAHGFTSAVISFLSGFWFRKRMIVTSHDVLNSSQFLGFSGRLKKRLLHESIARFDYVHSVSHDASDNLVEFLPNIDRSRCVVILNGVDSRYFAEATTLDFRKDYGIPDSCKVIGFFGRFMKQKGFKFLVDAVEYLNGDKGGSQYHVVCFGSGEYIREEKLEIERRGLSGFFTFASFIPDVSGAMKGCDLIAMPSLWEACPLQPMEALCCGVPFVGSDCIGMREVIKDTPAIVVQSGSAEALAEGIERCSRNGRESFLAYRPIAAQRFEVQGTANSIHDLYLRAME